MNPVGGRMYGIIMYMFSPDIKTITCIHSIRKDICLAKKRESLLPES